jgi:hypothetical protein
VTVATPLLQGRLLIAHEPVVLLLRGFVADGADLKNTQKIKVHYHYPGMRTK